MGNSTKPPGRFSWRCARLLSCLALAALLLSACKLPAPQETETPQGLPDAMFTSAAQTAEARRVLRPQGTPTPSFTPPPTPGTATVPAALQALAPTGSPIPTDDTIPENDRAEFVEDVTVPDGEAYAPGQRFTKTWRLKNTGSTTWSARYALIYISGSLMDAPPTVALTQDVPPGETVDLSVELVAPAEAGIYQAFWKLRNGNGQIFGVGADGVDAFWVTIAVDTHLSGTVTPATPVGKVVTSATVRVDSPERTGNCPQVFRVTVDFALDRAATVTYSLEAGSQETSEIKLPPPVVRNLDAGSHSVIYELTFASTIHGWVRVHFTQPDDVTSPQVEFKLVCE